MHILKITKDGLIESGIGGMYLKPSELRQLRVAIEHTLEMYKTEEINDEDIIGINKNIIDELQRTIPRSTSTEF